jgi:hypothetical protein
VKILKRDLRAAGMPIEDDNGRVIDVHALRHTTATFLAKAGVAPRTAQSIMRHSDIRLTLGSYTDPQLLDEASAVDALPTFDADATSQRPYPRGGDSESLSSSLSDRRSSAVTSTSSRCTKRRPA